MVTAPPLAAVGRPGFADGLAVAMGRWGQARGLGSLRAVVAVTAGLISPLRFARVRLSASEGGSVGDSPGHKRDRGPRDQRLRVLVSRS